jgi:hypothetical protein
MILIEQELERVNVCSVAAADASSAWREWYVCTYWRTMALPVEWIHYIFLLRIQIIHENQTVKSCTPTDPILSYS